MVRASSAVLAYIVVAAACVAVLGGCSRPPDVSNAAGQATTDKSAPRTPTATTSPPPTGPDVDVALAFVRKLNSGDHAAAYQHLSPLSRDAIAQADWTQTVTGKPTRSGNTAFLCVANAKDYTVGEVTVAGDRAAATVKLARTRPVPIHVVREGGKWWVDWTEEAQVRSAVDSALSVFTPGGGALALALMQGGRAGLSPLEPISSPLFTTCEVVSAIKDGDRAVVEIAGTGTATAVCALLKRTGRWTFDPSDMTIVEDAADPGKAQAEALAAMPRAMAKAAQMSCLSNLKQICLGLLMYAQDHDERLPAADDWSDAIGPYLKNESLLKCPSSPDLECGYAYNQNLSGKSLSDIRYPANTIMVFDSTIGRRNAADAGQSWPEPGRHNDGNDAGYVDGHCKWLKDKPDFSLSPPGTNR